ncbi:MAG TPA: transposase [Gammaproteobacteria bacterium]|nr:transposase [Gammaproteobacteria bacterium]
MSNYKRCYLPDHSYFFTVVTANRCPLFAEKNNVALLRAAIRYVKTRKPFVVEAICVLPDHIHCIWTLTEDSDYSTRWQVLKTYFSRQYRRYCPQMKTVQIWQPRYWEHAIRNQGDFDRHLDYIHYNPVKHGYVSSACQWPYSSYGRYLEKGHYDADWGCVEPAGIAGMDFE